MPVNQFEVELQRPAVAEQVRDESLPAMASHEAPLTARECIARAGRCEIGKQGLGLPVGNAEPIDIEEARRQKREDCPELAATKARPHEQVTDIVHVVERGNVRLGIDGRPGSAQFGERVGPEAREGEHAPGNQDSSNLGKNPVDLVDKGQQQVGEDDVDAVVREWQLACIRLYARRLPEPARRVRL